MKRRLGVYCGMQWRWRLVLPSLGLAFFAILSWHSVHWNKQLHLSSRRYFWWGSIRLDSDALSRHSLTRSSCANGIEDCAWNPEFILIAPGWIQKALMFSALPAFVAGLAAVHVLGRLGVDKVVSFMVCTPVFVFAWFYLVGWLLDQRKVRTISSP